jgi:hypothetical protein
MIGSFVARADRLRAALFVVALISATAVLALAPGATAATAMANKKLILFSVATGMQYVHSVDDEKRGLFTNPFSAATRKLSPTKPAAGAGPFPGDVLVFSFDLYGDAKLKHATGSAQLSCYYNYNLEALCEAYYDLSKTESTLSASGPVNFNKHGTVTLVVTGGTARYLGVRGELIQTAAAVSNAQRLEFVLVGQ